MNAVEIEAAVSDLALQPFDAEEFPFAFLAAFGNKETTLKRLRAGNNNASDVPGGVLLRNNIHSVVCDTGAVGETLRVLRASPATTKAKAKFILATDGQTLEAEELTSGETIACAYQDFPNHFGFFLPLAGISTIKEIKDNPIDVRATGRLNKLYVELLSENPDWAKDERRADMNHFMARLVFCFFAEDTDIFNGEGLFTRTVEKMSERDGSNTHEVLETIFRAMNVKVVDRANAQPSLPNWANGFPYVNGGLFSGSTEVPRFTRMARTYLLHTGTLNWRQINPDIFGSMIQAVADDEERGALGMHYTSVPNILKVLNPLFLDELRTQLTRCALHDCMLQDSCSLCGVVVETGLLRQRPAYLCEECGEPLKAGQGDPHESLGGLRWKHRPRDVGWLESLLQTVPLSTLKDLLDARLDRWFFHTQRYLVNATGQARLSLETLSRHPPSRTSVGCMHVEERDVLFSLIEKMVQVS